MKLVLDTHCWIWLMLGDEKLPQPTRLQIEHSARTGELFIPAISVWEVAMLESKGRLTFNTSVSHWVEQALSVPGVRLMPLTPEIAIDSCNLPGELHGDPADRLIVAAARIQDAALVTHDQKILAYAKHGFVRSFES
jgi:PIN domain nuclease of toxin-antitoxin system